MSDPMTQQQHEDADLEWYEDEEPLEAADEEAPRRPRRRLVTPATGALAALVLVAAGFFGGVQVQKGQAGATTAGGPPSGFAARFGQGGGQAGAGGGGQAGGGAGGAAGGAGATTGTVADVKGSTLYVTTGAGTTVKVRTDSNSKVTRNAASTATAVHPGDTVVVQGAKASSGTVTASSITATAKGVPSFGGFGGGGAGGGGGAAGGSASGSGGSGAQVPQGFAPPAG
jgi:hypothetical protein